MAISTFLLVVFILIVMMIGGIMGFYKSYTVSPTDKSEIVFLVCLCLLFIIAIMGMFIYILPKL